MSGAAGAGYAGLSAKEHVEIRGPWASRRDLLCEVCEYRGPSLSEEAVC